MSCTKLIILPEYNSSKASDTTSVGACSYIVFSCFGGSLVRVVVDGKSHWFNRVQVRLKSVDLDLTGDQFGRLSVQITEKDTLYQGERLRQPQELTKETLFRAKMLAN